MGAPGEDGVSTQWTSVEFIVNENQWQLAGKADEIGSYYYCVYEAPEITQAIYDDGLITCNYRYTDDTGTNVQTTLPYTEYFMDVDIVNSKEHPFSMQISYNTTPTARFTGTVEFRITFSDFYTKDKRPPASCYFKLILVY